MHVTMWLYRCETPDGEEVCALRIDEQSGPIFETGEIGKLSVKARDRARELVTLSKHIRIAIHTKPPADVEWESGRPPLFCTPLSIDDVDIFWRIFRRTEEEVAAVQEANE